MQKKASFNYKKYSNINIRKLIYCKSHKLDNIINIKNKRCKTELCDIFIFNKQYKGYCLTVHNSIE